MDFYLLRLPLAAPAVDLVSELGLGGNASFQALAAQGREVQFYLVEPRAALGRVVDLEPVGQALRHGGRQSVVKSAQGVGVKLVLHQPDFGGLRVTAGQLLHELGVLALGALGPHLVQALPGQRLDGGQHAATAVLGIGVVFLARLRGHFLDNVAEQKARPLVEANHGIARVVGPGVERD